MSLSNLEKIRVHLLIYGITKEIDIEPEVENLLLEWLESDDLDSVALDKEGGLMFEFRDSADSPTMESAISAIEYFKQTK